VKPNISAAHQEGHAIEVPQYDFSTHKRLDMTTRVDPPDVLIVDGIFTLCVVELRSVSCHTRTAFGGVQASPCNKCLRCVLCRRHLGGVGGWTTTTHRDAFDLKLFVDADSDVCLSRRLRRDIVERGRDVDSVLAQYVRFVKPARTR